MQPGSALRHQHAPICSHFAAVQGVGDYSTEVLNKWVRPYPETGCLQVLQPGSAVCALLVSCCSSSKSNGVWFLPELTASRLLVRLVLTGCKLLQATYMANEKRHGRAVWLGLGNVDSVSKLPGAHEEEPSAVADAKRLVGLLRQKLA